MISYCFWRSLHILFLVFCIYLTILDLSLVLKLIGVSHVYFPSILKLIPCPFLYLFRWFKTLSTWGQMFFPYLQEIVSKNYNSMLAKVSSDLQNWSCLPNYFQARISVIKMNVLPPINLFSSIIPLTPPVGYWNKLDACVSRYIWDGKHPRIKLTTLQQCR